MVWIDGGKDFSERSGDPWSTDAFASYLLPTIRHKHMVALKCHLVSDALIDDETYANQAQSASLLHIDYGRSLRPNVMAVDAFYALNEVFSLAASSEIQFLNLIDVKLDQYTKPGVAEFDSLPNLKYTKEILYRHIQKIQQALNSMRNAKHPKWPKASNGTGKKAKTAAEGLEQDFDHLLNRAKMLHKRCHEAIAVLMSSISISESKKAIEQAKRVGKLTFLAFIFVPLSFTTSFFGMNVRELTQEHLSIYWWVVFSSPIFILTVTLFYYDITRPLKALYRYIRRE